MFRTVQPTVWAFDCEWVPDAEAGRRLLGLPPGLSERAVFEAMWKAAGATAKAPRPFLKTALCRVASIAVVERRVRPGRDGFGSGEVCVRLCSLPREGEHDEAEMLQAFFDGLARRRPQLVGFHSLGADLHVLVQRGVAQGLRAPGLCARPTQPWNGLDYFYPHGEGHVDLMRVLGGGGATCPSLHEMALVAGIPAKLGADGASVAELWLAGAGDALRRYNECDALTTYLLWLRTAHFAGCFSNEAYAEEEGRVERLLEAGAERGEAHLEAFLQRWRLLKTPYRPRLAGAVGGAP